MQNTRLTYRAEPKREYRRNDTVECYHYSPEAKFVEQELIRN